MKASKKLSMAGLLTVLGFCVYALDGTQIMTAAYDRQKPETTKAAVTLTLTDKKGFNEVRNVGEYGRDIDGNSEITMVFFSPKSVAGTRFLLKEQKNAEDLKYIFLPSLGNVRQVASSEGSSSFVGTDFTYSDLSTREVSEDTHTLIKESEDKGNFKDLYKVESIPINTKDSQYSKRISWITKDSFIPVYVELYDKKGKLQKTNEITSIEQKQGKKLYNIPMENVMTNVQTGHSTSIKMLKVEVDIPMSDGYFSTAFIKNGKL